MKFCILFIASLFLKPVFSPGLYDISIELIDGKTIQMDSYKDSKIVILTFNPAKPDENQFTYLDSLQKNNKSLRVLAIPSLNMGSTVSISSLQEFKKKLKLEMDMAKPANTAKSTATGQHKLYKWLTNVTENSHFNNDALETGQLFIVSEKGTLYAVLSAQVPREVLLDVIKSVPVE
jgi:glutathione peroxidase-family protein